MDAVAKVTSNGDKGRGPSMPFMAPAQRWVMVYAASKLFEIWGGGELLFFLPLFTKSIYTFHLEAGIHLRLILQNESNHENHRVEEKPFSPDTLQ